MTTVLNIDTIAFELLGRLIQTDQVNPASQHISMSYRSAIESFPKPPNTGIADYVWWKSRTIAGSSNDDIDLQGGLTDIFGSIVNVGQVFGIIIMPAAANAGPITLGNAAANGAALFFGAVTHTVSVRPGGLFVIYTPETGWTVTADTGDILRINNPNATAVTYKIGLIVSRAESLSQIIFANSLDAGLVTSIDMGDYYSVSDGSAQLVKDEIFNLNFYRGINQGAASDDPTFNGTIDARTRNEYFSLDGGDYLSVATAAPAAVHNMHKNSAKFSYIMAVYMNGANTHCLFGSLGDDSAATGIELKMVSGRQQQLITTDAVGFDNISAAAATLGDAAWHIIGGSVDEAGGNVSFYYADGAYNQVGGSDTFDAAYAGPKSGDATHAFQIGAGGGTVGGALPAQSGTRIGCFALWEGVVLTKANFDTIFARLGPRYGLL